MLEVLNILNADVTNGNKNYCMISEEQLNAIKKLAKIEDKEKNI